ncbi:MAG: hypothetical protein IKC63_03170 [Clostridia bacterium]|nr:hypothetical protein [Clostridia bacterium]
MDELLYNDLAKAVQYYQVREELTARIEREEEMIAQSEADFSVALDSRKKPMIS